MEISESQLKEDALAQFGHSASAMLSRGEFDALAAQFGYALAFDRIPAKAIEEDLSSILFGNSAECTPEAPQVTVKYFGPNSVQLLALVECVVPIGTDVQVLLELVAARNGQVINLYLEDLSAVT